MKQKIRATLPRKLLATVISTVMLSSICLSNSFIKANATQTLPDHIIINQVYGAGPAPDFTVPVSNSFIELYNPTDAAINLTDYSLWYRHGNSYTNAAFTDGTAVPVDNDWYKLSLTGTIPANGSYLVKAASALKIESCDPVNMKAPATSGKFNADNITSKTVHLYFNDSDLDLPANSGENKTWNDAYAAMNIPTVTADQNWNLRLANKGVEVLLVDPSGRDSYTAGTTGAGGTSTMPVNPFNTDGNGKKVTGYVDMFGVAGNDNYNSTIDGYEGSFTSIQSKQKSLRRIAFQDTEKNSEDFEVIPYNAAYIAPWGKPRSTADGQWNATDKPIQPDDTAFGTTVPVENPVIYPSMVTAADAQIVASTDSVVTASNAQYATKANAPYCVTNTFIGDPKTERSFTWNAPISVTDGQVQISTSNVTVNSTASGKKYANTIDYSSFTTGIVSNIQTSVTTSAQKLYDAPLNQININNFSVFRATTTGLESGKTYYYRVGNNIDGWSPVYTFTTESLGVAQGADAFTFLHVSDTQATNLADYQSWQSAIDKYTPSLKQPISFLLHTGDECDGTNREDEWRGFFGTPTYNSLGLTASGDYRYNLGNNAFMPVVGNHEQSGPLDPANAAGFTEHFTVPSNGPSDASVTPGTVYSYDYGSAHFVVLNTQTDLEAQAAWLANDLASTDKKWKIVALHKGLYESPGSDENLISTFGSILDKYGVDLILQGHDHVYVKSKAMRNGQVDPNGIGTISLETGSSGAKQDSAGGLLNYEEVNLTNGAPAFSSITVSTSGITVDTKKVVTNADKTTTLTDVNSFTLTTSVVQKLAEVLTSQIAALPSNITLENKDAVVAARNIYNGYSAAEQALVTNYSLLTAAESKIASLQDEAAAAAASAIVQAESTTSTTENAPKTGSVDDSAIISTVGMLSITIVVSLLVFDLRRKKKLMDA